MDQIQNVPGPSQDDFNTLNTQIATYRSSTTYTKLSDITSMLQTVVNSLNEKQTKNVLFTTGTDTSLSPFTAWNNFSGYITKVNASGTYWVAYFVGIDGKDVEVGCNNGTITCRSLNTQITPLTAGEMWVDFVDVSTLTNGTNYGNGCKYRRIGCFVHILIGVQFSSAPSNTEIFTLPVGYRPITATTIPVDGGASYNAKAQCTISDGGAVRVTSVDKWVIGGGLFVAVGNL